MKFLKFFLLCSLRMMSFALSKEAATFSLEEVIEKADPCALVGVKFIDLETNEALCSHLSRKLFVPGSVTKLFSGGAALGLLGGDFSFTTSLYIDGSTEGGEVKGDLYFKGSGDPSLASSDLRKLVDFLKQQGIHSVKGNLYIDDTEFDDQLKGPGRPWHEPHALWTSPVTSWIIDHNCATLRISLQDKKIRCLFSPTTDYFKINNAAVIASSTNNFEAESKGCSKGEEITLKGHLSEKEPPFAMRIPFDKPNSYAAYFISKLMQEFKISIHGTKGFKQTPKTAKLAVSHSSKPLKDLIKVSFMESDNLYADAIFKKLAAQFHGSPATWENGARIVTDYFHRILPQLKKTYKAHDGSGGARYNLVSPENITDFLYWIEKESCYKTEFKDSLPQASMDGTLKRRFNRYPALKGKIWAKTGTLLNVSGLAGYMLTKKGKKVAFAILTNSFTVDRKKIHQGIEEEICKLVWESF